MQICEFRSDKRPTQDLLTVNRTLSVSQVQRVQEGVQNWEHADDPLLPPIAFVMPPRAALVEGFASVYQFDLSTVFQRRAVVMRIVPPILRGPFRNALRIAMDEAIGVIEVFDELRQERAWKLFLLLPRMSAPRTRWTGATIPN